MSIKKSLVVALVIISNVSFGQQSLNDYKYVIVPKRFDFLKSEDQYQVNSLTKFLFEKEGFTTSFDNNRPEDLVLNPCKVVTAKVKDNSSMFSTKLVIELIDCKNEVVFTSIEGKSKIKEYKKAYHEALRRAFQSITELNYTYESQKSTVAATNQVEEKAAIESVKEDIPAKAAPIETAKEASPVKVVNEDISTKVEQTERVKENIPAKVVPTSAVKERTPVESVKKEIPTKAEIVKEKLPVKEKSVKKVKASKDLLYAQANDLGYQLVDSSPKVVYVLLRSSREDVYFLKNKSGAVFKEGGKWFAEYYNGKKLVKRELQIKF